MLSRQSFVGRQIATHPDGHRILTAECPAVGSTGSGGSGSGSGAGCIGPGPFYCHVRLLINGGNV